MSGARDAILGAIRESLGRGALTGSAAAPLERRLGNPQPNVVPARGQLDRKGRIELFIAEAEKVSATTTRVASRDEVPKAIADYLRASNLPATIKTAPHSSVTELPWDSAPSLEVTAGGADPEDAVSVTPAFAGVAETGTVVTLSGPTTPTGLNFLPLNHVVVIDAADIDGTYENVWSRMRDDLGAATMPRTVNWITGPSRTADIEQTLLLGAHGPQRLHIVVVDGEGT